MLMAESNEEISKLYYQLLAEHHASREKMQLLDLNDEDLLCILQFLDQKSLLAMSKTCTRLRELCLSTSSLWRSFTVKLGQKYNELQTKVRLTEDEKEALEISGDRVQNMCIYAIFEGRDEFDPQTLELLSKASTDLKEFTFKVREFGFFVPDNPPLQKFSEPLIQLLKDCLTGMRNAKLEKLSLDHISWIANKYRVPLLQILQSETLCQNVKSLSLDCFFSRVVPMIAMQHYQQTYEVSCRYGEVIGQFKNLHTLMINSIYLTSTLLESLSQSGNARLQALKICVDCFQDVPITAWRKLLKSCPALEVTISIDEEFVDTASYCTALPACVPIARWDICCFEKTEPDFRTSHKDLFNLLCFYAKTLKYVFFQTSSPFLCHSALLEMVTKCSKLQTLHLHFANKECKISCNSILQIASLQRKWLKLCVYERNIVYPKKWTGSREENTARLCQEVSEKVGYRWNP